MGKKLEKALEVLETGLQVAGTFVPLVSVIGVGVGIVNKKFAQKNMEYFAERLARVEVVIGEMTEQQERNFTFRIVDIVNKVAKERSLEKIDMFANVIRQGVITGTILSDDEEMDKIGDVLDLLHLDDIEFMEHFYKHTRIPLNGGGNAFHYFTKTHFKELHYMNKARPEPINGSGFKVGSNLRLQRCIAYGLVLEEMKEDTKKMAGGSISYGGIPLEQHKYELQYSISDFYCKLRTYILTAT